MPERRNTIEKNMNILYKNDFLRASIGLFLILYSGLIAPKLPKSVLEVFNNPIIKFLIIFIISFLSNSNKNLAIISSVAFIITIQVLNSKNLSENFSNNINSYYDKISSIFISFINIAVDI